ncbi:1991_t:CDS:2 [Dentiscutata erythropus]|uniref:1991_t:CDS:1 n=1 Tax=Dentiscutata erythropus TaxID=1348616 RepID=A0A9N9BJM7_9GLOM|nr:1991_t:CDS:2 [Dentiscutata erythropus]
MLVELLKQDKSVLLECKGFTLFISSKGSFEVKKSDYSGLASLPDTWYIIDGRCKKFYMPIWSEDEIVDCHNWLYDEKITQESIKKRFDVCGGVARWIFDTNMSLEEIKTIIQSATIVIDPRIIVIKANPS